MAKDKAAVALGKRRWRGKSKAQKRAHMRMMGLKSAAKKKALRALEADDSA